MTENQKKLREELYGFIATLWKTETPIDEVLNLIEEKAQTIEQLFVESVGEDEEFKPDIGDDRDFVIHQYGRDKFRNSLRQSIRKEWGL